MDEMMMRNLIDRDGGASFSIVTIFVWCIITLILVSIIRRFILADRIFDYAGKPYIALSSFRIGDGNNILKIEGRIAGIIGWIVAQLKIDGIFSFTITKQSADYVFRNLTGKIHINAPLKHATGTRFGYARSTLLLELGMIGLVVAVILLLKGYNTRIETVFQISLSLLFIVAFWFSKKLIFVVDIADSFPLVVICSEGTFVGITVKYEDFFKAHQLVSQAILRAK